MRGGFFPSFRPLRPSLGLFFFGEKCGAKAINLIKTKFIIYRRGKSMKENKTVQIKFRLTESQKKQVEEYAAAHDLNVSEVMRLALAELLNK
jgi:16S rRNA U516 pseudouridylate synthase RsuA-like enzyme